MCGRVGGVNIDEKGDPGILGHSWSSAVNPSEQRWPIAVQMQATEEVVRAREASNCREITGVGDFSIQAGQDRSEARVTSDPRSLRGQRMCKGVAESRAV